MVLQNLYLFYRYESTHGTTELILILLIREYPWYYRTYTYFTDTGVPVGTTEINQIQEYP